jgi:hypothetical protein
MLLTREQGKPLAMAHEEIGGSIAFLRFSSTQDLPHKTLRDNETEFVVETERRSALSQLSPRGTTQCCCL